MPQNSIKERRTVLLAMPETTYGVDAIAASIAASGTPFITNALLSSGADIVVNPEVLERENYNASLSKDTTGIGRMISTLTFQTELRNSGSASIAPRIGMLLRGCGMSETLIPNGTAPMIRNPVGFSSNTSAAISSIISGLTKTTKPTKSFDKYRITVTTGGAPGTAKFVLTGVGFPDGDNSLLDSLEHKAYTSSATGEITVGGTLIAPTFTFLNTWNEFDIIEVFVGGIRFYREVGVGNNNTNLATQIAALIDADPRMTATASGAAITVGLAGSAAERTTLVSTAQAVTLGNSEAVVTLPSYTGNLTEGEGFDIQLRRSGRRYDPASDNHTSLTFWLLLDGMLHRVTGARGSFSITGEGAKYPMVSWNFMGLYTNPVDYPLPASVEYETSKPFKVELSKLAIYGMQSATAIASKFSMDMANELTPREDINARESFSEIQITDRTPVAGCDPEAVLPSEHSPWTRMRREDTTRFHVGVGLAGGAGNSIRIEAGRACYTAAPFAKRGKILAHEYQFRLARQSSAGNDEVFLVFY